MIAFKTFAQAPLNQRLPGIDLNVPWQQQRIARSEAAAFSAAGWTVVEEVEDLQRVVVQAAPTTEVINLGSKNSHTLQPFGAVKGAFNSNDHGFPITLSNKQEDGVTFNYNTDFPITPRVGDYVFQENFCLRAWITEVDTEAKTVVFDRETLRPELSEGEGHYSKGHWIDADIADWYPTMFLWGISAKCHYTAHDGKDDFVELSIVDEYDMFKTDEACSAIFGCSAADAVPILEALGWEISGEYNSHWTKYYDESMACNIDGRTIMSPDGSPGELVPHLKCRISYFTSKQIDNLNEIFLDYFFTAKI